MNMPLYVVLYEDRNTQESIEKYFYTTKAARDFLWNNRNKVSTPEIYLFNSFTRIREQDLRD